MSDFVTLSCPSCGAKLEITSDIDRFACAHCGNEHVVKRGGGLVALAPVVAEIQRVGAGVDKTASELAIRRLTEEIAQLEAEKPRGTGYVYRRVGGISMVTIVVLGALISSTLPGALRRTVGLASLALGAIVLGWLVLLGNKQDRLRQAEFGREIEAKRAELEKHRARVSAP
jgi:hypothetical protein